MQSALYRWMSENRKLLKKKTLTKFRKCLIFSVAQLGLEPRTC